MERNEFEDLVYEALSTVPEWFREKLENIEVVIEDEPPASLLKDMRVGRGGTLLGLYQGVPLSKRGFYYGNVLPDRIVLYQGTILRSCRLPEEIPGKVREVVIHEIGHYFGLSDSELRRLEGRG
jgi:predicted Zn-dependent protease with MMP-like domain